MAIQLVTFGGLRAAGDSGELERVLVQHSRAALLVFLGVERRVSRETLTAIFWPESDAENSRHALRQSLYQLRKSVGADWIDSRAHELVVSDDLLTDAHSFARAIERGDAESAVQLYQGPFLDGVHLVDLQPWESWVDGRRAQFARAFRKASRESLDARRRAGDLAGAIAAAERWAALDRSDDEAQHRLIEALADAGERAEAIRQFETYSRALGSDGLEPREETRRLAERLRSDPAPLPALRTATNTTPEVSVAAPEAAPSTAPAGGPGSASLASAQPRTRRPNRFLAAAVGLMVLFASVWSVRQWQTAPPAPSAAAPDTASMATVAVLPFTVRSGASVQYLGEGIVNLLAAALDGAGSLRPVDTRATFAAVSEEGGDVSDAKRGVGVAARLGAGSFVLGDVVEAGGRLQIEAVVYAADSGCARSSGAEAATGDCHAPEARSRAVVTGAADSVFALVDQLAARLLGGLGDPAADRLLRTASLTTTSLPALKAYLRGEASMRSGLFERAADDYLAAIALDSTFAVAHYRLALAREWAPLPGNEDAASAAGRHASRLSARDRMLLEAFRAWRGGDAVAAERAYHAILARYPDDIDAWFQLGEIQFHHGPLLGRAVSESGDAWRKVVSHEPRNLFALTHLARIAAVDGRASALDSILAQFGPEELRADRRLEELEILRAVAYRDTTTARALALELRRGESFSVWRVAAFLAAFGPDPALMRTVMGDLADELPNPSQRADVLWFASVLDLANGRARAARSPLAEAIESERRVPIERRRREFDAVTEWYAATLPLPYADSTLARVRRRAASLPPFRARSRPAFLNDLGVGTPIQLEPLRQYTLGVLSVRLGDAASAATAGAKLRALAAADVATALVRDLDRGLRARLALHEGKPEEALRLLEALEVRDSQGDIAVTPFVARANERYLRGEVLIALGRDDEALRWFASLGKGSVSEIPLEAPSHVRQAEIHERLGHRGEAARHHARLVELWRDADPEFQHFVDVARQRLASLTRRN